MIDNDDRLKTSIVGHRPAHYPGEPLSQRSIRRLDDIIPLTPAKKIASQSMYGIIDKPYSNEEHVKSCADRQ